MDDVTEVERSLQQALRHRPAPDGFTEKVMVRVARQSTNAGASPSHRSSGTLLQTFPAAAWWAAAAATLLLTLGIGTAVHSQQQETQRAQAAEAQLDQAFQMTSHALDEVTRNVNRSQAGQLTQALLHGSR